MSTQNYKDFHRWLNKWIQKNWKRWKDEPGVSKAEALYNFEESDYSDCMYDAYLAGKQAKP